MAQQQLAYQSAVLQRSLRQLGFPERLFEPTPELVSLLAHYYSLKALQNQGESSIIFQETSIGGQTTYLQINHFASEASRVPSLELERRINYLRMDRSRPEIIIRNTLEELFPGVSFPSVRPSFLRYLPTGRNLELDIYNASLRLAVEYNGIQHYEFTPAFHKSRRDLTAQQERDAFKVARVKELGIDLLTIPYTVQDEDIPNMVRAWVAELNRTPEEIAIAQRVDRCQEVKVSPEDITRLWSMVPDDFAPELIAILTERVQDCVASPDEFVAYEKWRWGEWLGADAIPEVYLRLRPFLPSVLRRISWTEGEDSRSALIRQVIELIGIAPGGPGTLSGADLFSHEVALMALYPALIQQFPELLPITDTKYVKGPGGRLTTRLAAENRRNYQPIVRFLNTLIGDYFGYHLEIIQEDRNDRRNDVLVWRSNDPDLDLLEDAILARGIL